MEQEKQLNPMMSIRYYSIIYDAVDDVKAALTGMLSPDEKENIWVVLKLNLQSIKNWFYCWVLCH